MEDVQNIADLALKESSAEAVSPVLSKNHLPGEYRADKFMRIIKKLSSNNKTDAAGNVVKVYATWTDPKNMIIFNKGMTTRLSAEDLELESIQRLIDSKAIYRVGD